MKKGTKSKKRVILVQHPAIADGNHQSARRGQSEPKFSGKAHLLCLLLAVCCLFCFSGCSRLFGYKTNRNRAIASFSAQTGNETFPQFAIPVSDGWFALNGSFGARSGLTVAFGSTPKDLQTVHTIEDGKVNTFEASGSLAAWCESEDGEGATTIHRFMVYDRSENKVANPYTFCFPDNEYYPENIGIYDGRVYWCVNEAEQSLAEVRSYAVDSGKTESVFRVAYNGKDALSCMTVDGEYLSVAHWSVENSPMITVWSLASGEAVLERVLPTWVRHVFGVSYDPTTENAVAYLIRSDNEECIYSFTADKNKDLFLICSFNEQIYAYHDRVKCRNGHVYWIFQLEKTGYVSDHYFLADYSFKTDQIVEYSRTYAFSVEGERMYTLSFNKQDCTAVNLRPF